MHWRPARVYPGMRQHALYTPFVHHIHLHRHMAARLCQNCHARQYLSRCRCQHLRAVELKTVRGSTSLSFSLSLWGSGSKNIFIRVHFFSGFKETFSGFNTIFVGVHKTSELFIKHAINIVNKIIFITNLCILHNKNTDLLLNCAVYKKYAELLLKRVL